jgi:APA family basic amino acid/polyamine antiporter
VSVGGKKSGAAPTKFGFWFATALVVGNVIGAGIFMLPASLAPFGWNAVAAWLATAAGALCLAWVFAELARELPDAGGSYGFVRLAFGDGPAFLAAWGYVVSMWAGNAAITVSGVSYLTRLVPVIAARPVGAPATALMAIAGLTWINLRGPRTAGRTQLVTSIIKLLPFVAVIALAAWRIIADPAAALPPLHREAITFSGISGAVGLTLYAMLGFESAAIPADTIDNPQRNVPLATMIGTGLCAVVSLLATCSIALMLPADAVAASKAPVADFIAVSLGGAASALVAACGVISCFGCLNGWLLLCGELPAAMAAAGTLPPWFARRNVHGAAAGSLLLGGMTTALLTLLALTKAGVAAYNFAALIATATNLLLYLFCTLALILFLRSGRLALSGPLVVCAAGAMVFVLWAFYGSGSEALGWGAALTAAGWPLYRLARRAAAVRTA